MTEAEKLHTDLEQFKTLRALTNDARALAILNEFIDTATERLWLIAANDC
jgi:hypothetical protein